jgi:hypothetical protein
MMSKPKKSQEEEERDVGLVITDNIISNNRVLYL